ncbi:hypothetical protein [Legionella waltersii]|nr:hypothetical protein [Legionella waltersii]
MAWNKLQVIFLGERSNLTLEAIEELESGGGKKYPSFKSMIDDLEEDEKI